MACEDCLEVCFDIVVIFMGFGQAGAKGCGGCLKSSIEGGDAKHKRRVLFIGKISSHYVILLYCETLLQVLL